MKVKNVGQGTFSLRDKDRNLFELRKGESGDVPGGLAEDPRLKSALRGGRLVEDTGQPQAASRSRGSQPRAE